jgi:membrane protein GlpM
MPAYADAADADCRLLAGTAGMISLFLKCALGAVAVLIIALLSRTRNFYIAGLVPLFPTLALIAHYLIGTERSANDLRMTALFGLWSLIPYAVYLLTVYWLSVLAERPVSTRYHFGARDCGVDRDRGRAAVCLVPHLWHVGFTRTKCDLSVAYR